MRNYVQQKSKTYEECFIGLLEVSLPTSWNAVLYRYTDVTPQDKTAYCHLVRTIGSISTPDY